LDSLPEDSNSHEGKDVRANPLLPCSASVEAMRYQQMKVEIGPQLDQAIQLWTASYNQLHLQLREYYQAEQDQNHSLQQSIRNEIDQKIPETLKYFQDFRVNSLLKLERDFFKANLRGVSPEEVIKDFQTRKKWFLKISLSQISMLAHLKEVLPDDSVHHPVTASLIEWGANLQDEVQDLELGSSYDLIRVIISRTSTFGSLRPVSSGSGS